MRSILHKWAGPGILTLIGVGVDIVNGIPDSYGYIAFGLAGLWLIWWVVSARVGVPNKPTAIEIVGLDAGAAGREWVKRERFRRLLEWCGGWPIIAFSFGQSVVIVTLGAIIDERIIQGWLIGVWLLFLSSPLWERPVQWWMRKHFPTKY